jgi:ankyrin repeat protein
MFKKIMSKINPSNETLKETLLDPEFDADKALSLINSSKIDINYTDQDDNTFLTLTLQNKRYRAACWLIEHGIDTDIEIDGVPLIRAAVNKGATKVVKALLKYRKVDINQVDLLGRSLLQDAIIMGHLQIIDLLIKHNIDPNIIDHHGKNAMFDAIDYGEEKIIDTILAIKGINLNVIDENGKTILHNKKVLEDDQLAKKLLRKGANPTINDKEKHNFLVYTVLRGEEGEELLDIALEQGCDLNTRLEGGNTILMEVMHAFIGMKETGDNKKRQEMERIAKKLIKNGIDINAVNNKGENVLFDLVRVKDIDGCRFLLEHNVDPNIINNYDETLLLIACLQGYYSIEMIKLLLENGANPIMKLNSGKTLCEILNEVIFHVENYKSLNNEYLEKQIVEKAHYLEVLREIVNTEGYDFEYLDSQGQALFMTAFMVGHNELCQTYLKSGIDINEKDKDGLTLFYKYNLAVFEKGKYFEEYRSQLIYLILHKADVTVRNKDGQTIYSRVAMIENCNKQLFNKLREVSRYDFKTTDNQGRTIMHACVWGKNLELLKVVHGIDETLMNIPDKLNILPITYAAIFGNREIVIELIKKESYMSSKKEIPASVKKKFRPLLKNLKKLVEGVTDAAILGKLKIVISQVIKDMS